MLHCQDQLTQAVEKLQERDKQLTEEIEKMVKQNKAMAEEVKVLRKETKKRRKMLEVQQECIYKGTDPATFQKVNLSFRPIVRQSLH